MEITEENLNMPLHALTPELFVKIQEIYLRHIQAIKEALSRMRNEVDRDYRFPANSSPAVAADVKVGAVFHYPSRGEDGPFWRIVEEVLRPEDKFKAYLSGGCRYGLYDAFVRGEGLEEGEGK